MKKSPLDSKVPRCRFIPIVATVGLLAALALLAAAASAEQEVQKNYAQIKIGEQIFHSYCTGCHGSEARGDGALAGVLKVAPADLTLVSHRNGGEFPGGEIEEKIDGRELKRHGSEMPIWGDILHDAEGGAEEAEVGHKIAALAEFLRSIQDDAVASQERLSEAAGSTAGGIGQ